MVDEKRGSVLEITELGNPVLWERAREVGEVSDPGIQALIDDLIETAYHANGVGIAAPQVGRTERIFIISSRPNARYPDAPEVEPTAIINPEIVSKSEETVKDWEGCLSIPGIRGLVPRAKMLRARYVTRDGKTEEAEFRDFIARVFQHELDHLDGVLFLDRVESIRDVFTEKEYAKILASKEEENL
jgi:peptide deformylase